MGLLRLSAAAFVMQPLVLLFLILGCDDRGEPPADAGPDASTTTTDPDGGNVDASRPDDAGNWDACDYVERLERSCTNDDECAVGLHQTDCCGNSVMVGFHISESANYPASESACQATYPECDCPAMLPATDSGEAVTDTARVRAACVSRGPGNLCLTYVNTRPPDGR